jgi:hypothetical protein
MWRKYFKLIKLVPGVVVTRQLGKIDFRSDNLKVSDLQRLYEDDFPYLELTSEGRRVLYGIEPSVKLSTPKPEMPPMMPDVSGLSSVDYSDEPTVAKKSKKKNSRPS